MEVLNGRRAAAIRGGQTRMTLPPTLSVLHVVGARPNFMKVAPVMAAIDAWNDGPRGGDLRFEQVLVHTGQHYDELLSEVFLRQLDMPRPQQSLGVGSGSHAQQTARLLERLESLMVNHIPDLVVVPGDVNSTLAAALVAAKLNVPVAHLEAGLRSGDRSMPEEVNRVVTDHVSHLLLTTCADADANLMHEGIPAAHVANVGNTMIDSLFRLLPCAEDSAEATRAALGLTGTRYALVTLHRPSNVDDLTQLQGLLNVLEELSHDLPVVFPLHLRTRARVAELEERPAFCRRKTSRLIVTEPLGYIEFLGLMKHAAAVVTDSGGVQEETTVLGVPCITVRTTTERPITIAQGTNRLADPADHENILSMARAAVAAGVAAEPPRLPLWDGNAASRVVEALSHWALDRL